MKASECAVGTLVQLVSGGPVMTIEEVKTTGLDAKKGVWCQWFAGKKLERGKFDPATLVPATTAAKSKKK